MGERSTSKFPPWTVFHYEMIPFFTSKSVTLLKSSTLEGREKERVMGNGLHRKGRRDLYV